MTNPVIASKPAGGIDERLTKSICQLQDRWQVDINSNRMRQSCTNGHWRTFMMLDLIVLHLDTGQLLMPLLECASQIVCFYKASFLNAPVSFMSLLMTYMHILFYFLHYIHTSCEVVEVVITTLARYMMCLWLLSWIYR